MDKNLGIKLSNGKSIPIIGIGTWDMYKNDLLQALEWAFDAGYRHIDTATYYKNEKEVGKAVKSYNLDRSEFFITSKIWPNDFGYESTFKAFDYSFKQLNMEYIDLYLIHWPSSKKKNNDTWRALLEIMDGDRLHSIGVSNYSETQIEELKNHGDTMPVNNQVEFHPFNFDAELLDYSKSEGISLTAYSPLVEGKKLDNKKLMAIANNYNKTTAQILIRWGIQKGVIEIPKSSNKERIYENIAIFDFAIDDHDMAELDNF